MKQPALKDKDISPKKKFPRWLKILLIAFGSILLLVFILAVIFLAWEVFQSKKDQADDEKVNALLEDAKEYYNCKYNYTFKYPDTWTISDETHESDKVFVYGNEISFSFSALPSSQYPSLDAYINQRLSEIEGKVKVKELTNREDFNGTLIGLTNPEALLLIWPYNNYFMEMYGSGKKYANDNPESYLVGTSLNVNQNLSQCLGGTPSEQVTSTGGVDPDTCQHPNGDVEYWWYSAPQSARDCYIARYGQLPPFLQSSPTAAPTKKLTVDPNTCQHPNGDVEYWWNQATEAEKECFRVRNPNAPILQR